MLRRVARDTALYAVGTKADRTPEGLPIPIADKHVDADARRVRPDIVSKPAHSGARDALATMYRVDE